MIPRFVGRVGLADAITVANAVVGFLAIVLAFHDTQLSARLLLLAAIADGLDGIVARHHGSTDTGEFLDSLADVSSFAVAPAVLVYAVVVEEWSVAVSLTDLEFLVALGIPSLFVAMAVTRLGLYTAYDTDDHYTLGVPSTLAATIIGASILADVGLGEPVPLLVVTTVFSYLMVTRIEYPDLLPVDAFIMGVVHALAVLVPVDPTGRRTFPVALLTLALAYFALSPWCYWRDGFPSLPWSKPT